MLPYQTTIYKYLKNEKYNSDEIIISNNRPNKLNILMKGTKR